MRKLALLACGLVLAGGGLAWAQVPPAVPEAGPPGERPGMERHGPWEMEHGHHGRHGGDGAAGFHFARGDMEFGVRCSDRETMQACVSAASALIDKLNPPPKAP